MLATEPKRRVRRPKTGRDDALFSSSVVVADRLVRTPVPALIEAQADSVDAYAPDEAVPAHLLDLDGGEVVVLAIKPSPWFVLFRSARWLAAVTFVVLALRLVPALASWTAMITQAGQTAALLVVFVHVMQWVSRHYVLTNRRMMRFHGVMKVAIFQIPLIRIDGTTVSIAPYERLTRLGTIFFDTPTDPTDVSHWSHIARPQEVQRTIDNAIRRAKHCASARDL